MSEETLSKRFCLGCAEIAFMQRGGQNLEIELVIDFAYFAFVARGKIILVTVLSSIQIPCRIFLCRFLSDVGPTRTFHMIPLPCVTSVTINLPVIPV